jgi:hypothetical protein
MRRSPAESSVVMGAVGLLFQGEVGSGAMVPGVFTWYLPSATLVQALRPEVYRLDVVAGVLKDVQTPEPLKNAGADSVPGCYPAVTLGYDRKSLSG